jgi:acetate kinase
MSLVLVVNAGSSSLKYQLIDPQLGERLAAGLVERIGEGTGHISHRGVPGSGIDWEWEASVPDHATGFSVMLDAFERSGVDLSELTAVGHRVVQGGSDYFLPTIVTDAVANRISELSVLAPLHNPGEHQAIVAARAVFPDVAHVAVFDTAFHQSMPPAAYTYAIDRELAAQYGVRRYGFHGTSHGYVSRLAAQFLDRPYSELKQIVLHLGNGASMCAVDGGRSVDTSMGLTPLQGLVMGTRSGDIDPSVLFLLSREAGMGIDELDQLLNTRSGLLGLAGSGDMRDVRRALEAGDHNAQLAYEVTVHRIRHYLGAYLVGLGGADTIVFTAGIGENLAVLRTAVIDGLGWFGIELDAALNASEARGVRRISSAASRVEVLVVPTDEEREIALQTLAALGE